MFAEPRETSLACLTGLPPGHSRMSLKEGTNLMKLLGQMIWELGEFFGEVIWQMMATIQIIAVLLIVGVLIEP